MVGSGCGQPYNFPMHQTPAVRAADKPAFYAELQQQAEALLTGERDRIANAANLSALIWQALPGLNWAGFYLHDGRELVLGPFQGKPACVRIAIGRGVCGTAAQERQTVIVADVHQFPGHIACDSASNSEIVVPLLDSSRVLGVLDLDSPIFDRFDVADQRGLEALAALWVRGSNHPA